MFIALGEINCQKYTILYRCFSISVFGSLLYRNYFVEKKNDFILKYRCSKFMWKFIRKGI